MIDIETEVFSIVSAEVRKKYPKIYMTGEYVKSPPSFPCVSLIETDNQVYRNTRDSGCIENHAQVLYEVNVYSNKTSGKKTECKAIMRLLNFSIRSASVIRHPPVCEDCALSRTHSGNGCGACLHSSATPSRGRSR